MPEAPGGLKSHYAALFDSEPGAAVAVMQMMLDSDRERNVFNI